ncbi:MAG: hypothetical protein MMC23_005061 [Stictis urceolatum]|nr:hypothetical protein [Stictis urceolata]
MRFSISLSILPLTIAGQVAKRSPLLTSRQSTDCYSTEKICGDGCILESYTCCPDQSGGCPSYAFCDKGDNGEYGCCPEGESCSGDGGVNTDFGGVGDTNVPSFSTPTYSYTSYSFSDDLSSEDDFSVTTSGLQDETTTRAAGGFATDPRITAEPTTNAATASSSSSTSSSPSPTSTLKSGGGSSGSGSDSGSNDPANSTQAGDAINNNIAIMGAALAAGFVAMLML